jgi:MFS family permease
MVAVALASLLFGLSQNFWLSVALRFLQGLSNCTFIVSKVMIPDVCAPEHIPRAMGMVFSTWGFALIAGPAASGMLAHPERSFPAALFPASSVFVENPYLLPTVVSALLCGIGFLSTGLLPSQAKLAEQIKQRSLYSAVGVDDEDEEEGEGAETSPLVARNAGQEAEEEGDSKQAAGAAGAALAQGDVADAPPQKAKFLSVCMGDGSEAQLVRKVIALDLLRGYYVLGDDNMFPLFGAAPRSAGGLGYTSTEIGAVFGAAGIVVILAQLLVYPQLTKLGLRRSSIIICAMQIPFQVCLPLCGSIRDDGLRDIAVFVIVCVKCAFVSYTTRCYACLTLWLGYCRMSDRVGVSDCRLRCFARVAH